MFRARITNIITTHLHKHKYTVTPLNKLFIECKMFFKNHPNFLVFKSDKGDVTIVMDKNTYNNKMIELLSDPHCFIRLSRNPTGPIQSKANEIVDRLLVRQAITPSKAKY